MSIESSDENLGEQTQRVLITLLHIDIDLAFSYLRLAETESKFGNRIRAARLIEESIIAYKSVARRLDDIQIEADEERSKLGESATKLFQAIVATERQFNILAG